MSATKYRTISGRGIKPVEEISLITFWASLGENISTHTFYTYSTILAQLIKILAILIRVAALAILHKKSPSLLKRFRRIRGEGFEDLAIKQTCG
jgi:hypothetical protein